MGEIRGRTGLVACAAVLAVAIGALAGTHRPETPPTPVSDTVSPERAGPALDNVAVHVSGSVVRPGVVYVPLDSIVADAIDAAGGLLPEARVDQVNLAAPVSSGEQIVVPGPEDEVAEAAVSNGMVSLNQATVSDLETLPGVGPVLAERIVAFRESNGPFQAVEDLLEVPGIGEAKLAAMRDSVKP
jgi:competence protein ComEA